MPPIPYLSTTLSLHQSVCYITKLFHSLISIFKCPFSSCKICCVSFFIQGFRSPDGSKSDHRASAGSPRGEPGGEGQLAAYRKRGGRWKDSIIYLCPNTNHKIIVAIENPSEKQQMLFPIKQWLTWRAKKTKKNQPFSQWEKAVRQASQSYKHKHYQLCFPPSSTYPYTPSLMDSCHRQSTFQRKLSRPHPKPQVWVSVPPC